MKYKKSFAFLAKLAIICNAFYLFTTAFLFLSWLKIPASVANFIAVLGLEMAPFINLIFAFWFLLIILRKKEITIPKWQTIINVLMLLLQIILLIL